MRSAARQEREPDLLPGYRAISGSAGLAPLVNTRLHLHMLRQAAMFACGWLFTQTLVAIVAGVAVAAGASLAGVLSLWAVCAALTGLVLAVAFWLLPVPAPVAQWSLLVQHGAAAAQPALAYITKALRDRGTPLDSAGLRSPGQGQRDYLELRHGRFTGCVSCFAHGRDLYVGWTFWLHLSPLRLLLLSVAGKAPNMSGRRSGIEQMLRYETASATVAAVHGAVLEAIDTATAELDPAGRRLLRGDRREFKFG
jgi:hypothetical protein